MTPTLLLLAVLASDPPPSRAEVCHAHVSMMIEEALAENGRVAGPSWFIRDWWDERRTDAERETVRERHVSVGLRALKAADPEVWEEQRSSCIDEAINGGAVPGL
ncbi:MAG: hypothetical protein ACK4Z5_06020 [Brevundimonas sp.]